MPSSNSHAEASRASLPLSSDTRLLSAGERTRPQALVLSAGGFWAAWEIGAWEILRRRFQPDLIVGASAGALNGWAIASGASTEDLARFWLDPAVGRIIRFGLHRHGFIQGAPLEYAAREIFQRFRPALPFALTTVELPLLRSRIVRTENITWRHLAASCSIPFGYPPVEIEGKLHVDGGVRCALPLWAAEELGARRALALNVLNTPGFRALHWALGRRNSTQALQVTLLEPSRRLGSLRDAVVWNARNVERWIDLGRRDASSVMM